MVERLLAYADVHKERLPLARLFLLSYCFLLRVPSEAIPVTAHSGDCSLQSVGDTLVLSLKWRKNRPQGSRLVRSCWCTRSASSCPVHVLGPLLEQKKAGERLFPGVSAGDALCGLRAMLEALKVPRAGEYRTHDFRRGHAKDLQLSGMVVSALWPRLLLCFVEVLHFGKFSVPVNGSHPLSYHTWIYINWRLI